MNNYKRFAILLTSLGFMAASGVAMATPETPSVAPAGVSIVDAKQVQDLQAKGAVLVDTRKASEYGEGSIKGAVSIPYDPEKSTKTAEFDSSLDKFDLSKMADKNAHLVMFCNSGTCFKSYKAAVVLAKAGYKNVYWYRSGVPDWKARKLPME